MEKQSSSQKLHEIITSEWEQRMQMDPLLATRCGDHRYNDRLPLSCEENYESRAASLKKYLGELAALDRRGLSPEDLLNAKCLEVDLTNQLGDIEFKVYRMNLSKVQGVHVTLAELLDYVPLNTVQDYENYLARLEGAENYILENIELLRISLKQGLSQPRAALEGIEDILAPLVSGKVEESLFYKPFTSFPASFSEADRQNLTRRAVKAIQNSVQPGYRALHETLQKEYIPAARHSVGASALPGGKEYYLHCIRKHTTLDLTPQEIHETGLAEVARIHKEMEDVMKQTGFKGDFKEFLQFLRTDARFYATSPEALLKEAAYIMKRMDGELPRLFGLLPRTSYGIRPVPDYLAPRTTSAYYFPLAGDCKTAGFYYVNTYDLKSRPLYEYEALSLHEAVPGHHLQIALQTEMAEMPNFRRFSEMTAFIEGWALYAERLGLEVGFYQDPYSNFGRLCYEMWRAVRLVVDTGMHALSWTRQHAIDYMAANTSLSLLNITNEVDRYICWPAQALAYKIGELKVRELRSQAEKSLGSRFDLRSFHDVLLQQGSIPLVLLEEHIGSWINTQKNA